jgi:type IV pilus assembly protein PilQ
LTSLIVGRHTLVSFIEALQSLNLSEIQAVPSVTVLDNVQARIQVGEQTPLRVIDPGGGAVGGTLPTASVSIQETGIILEATPHVTANDNILLELRAERSAPQPAESDVGFIFNTQNATTRVLVEDGETVVIGGLTVTDRSDVRTGIPLLMDLPLVGRLFRVDRNQTIQRDLIILVTPHIVRN